MSRATQAAQAAAYRAIKTLLDDLAEWDSDTMADVWSIIEETER